MIDIVPVIVSLIFFFAVLFVLKFALEGFGLIWTARCNECRELRRRFPYRKWHEYGNMRLCPRHQWLKV